MEPSEDENARRLSNKADVQPGSQAILRFSLPASARGRWEMGCLLPDH